MLVVGRKIELPRPSPSLFSRRVDFGRDFLLYFSLLSRKIKTTYLTKAQLPAPLLNRSSSSLAFPHLPFFDFLPVSARLSFRDRGGASSSPSIKLFSSLDLVPVPSL